jgi:hypothetical protein
MSSRIIILLLIISLFLAGCASLFDRRKGYVHFWGYVMSQDGKPLESARVEINDSMIRTDAKGRYSILVKKSKRYVMNIRKQGWGTISKVVDTPARGGRWAMPRATVKTVDPTQFIFVQDNKTCLGPLSSRVNWDNYPLQRQPRVLDANGQMAAGQFSPKLEEAVKIVEAGADCPPGISIQIPANALVNIAGNPPGEKVQVSVSTVDLFTPDEMPGDFTVLGEDGRTMYMRSTGAGVVEVTAKGQPYQLKKGAEAVLTIPIDPTQLKAREKPAPTIPLLLYDEKLGVWRPRSIAQLNAKGDAYVAKIPHLSAFNMDILKTDPSCVKFLNAGIYGSFTLEITVSSDTGPITRDKTIFGYETGDRVHALYNLPNNTDITMRPFKDEGAGPRPLGTYMANTGDPHSGDSPPTPDYNVCRGEPVWSLTEVILQAANITQNCVELQWTCVDGAFEYHLQRLLPGGFAESPIPLSPASVECGVGPDPNTAKYTICSLMPGNSYTYKVTAVFWPPGNEAISNVINFTTSAPSAPPTVTNLQANPTSSESILLTWADVAGETGYRISGSKTLAAGTVSCPDPGATDYTEISLPQDSVSRSEQSLESAMRYYYNVQAVNSGVYSPDACVNATTGCNIEDTWQGSGSETWSSCDDPGDNGTYSINVDLSIDVQLPQPTNAQDTFNGSATITSASFPGARSELSLSGTLLPDGQIENGAYTYTDYDSGGNAVSGGNGIFDGSVTSNCNRISLNFSGNDTWGDICRASGSFSVNRY